MIENIPQAGIAANSVVEITESGSIEDIDFLVAVAKKLDPGFEMPHAFVVKAIINRAGVQCAILVDDAHADIGRNDVQKFISRLTHKSKLTADLSSHNQAQFSEGQPFFYVCPISSLRLKPRN